MKLNMKMMRLMAMCMLVQQMIQWTWGYLDDNLVNLSHLNQE